MEKIAPLGPVYQAGTLSGNPVAVAAGLATLALTEAPGFYERSRERTRALTEGLAAAAKRAGVDVLRATPSAACSGSISRRACPTSYAK